MSKVRDDQAGTKLSLVVRRPWSVVRIWPVTTGVIAGMGVSEATLGVGRNG
jgi:hypothetical protein